MSVRRAILAVVLVSEVSLRLRERKSSETLTDRPSSLFFRPLLAAAGIRPSSDCRHPVADGPGYDSIEVDSPTLLSTPRRKSIPLHFDVLADEGFIEKGQCDQRTNTDTIGHHSWYKANACREWDPY